MARDNGATSRLGLFMTARAVHYNTTPPVSLQAQVKQGIENKTGYLNVFQCKAPPIPTPRPLPPTPLHDETAMRTSTHSPDPHAGKLGDPHIAGQPLGMQTSSTPQQDLVRAHDGLPNVPAVNATADCPAQRPGAPSVFPSGYAAASLSACLPNPRAVADAAGKPLPYRPNLQTKPLGVAHVDVAHQHHLLPVPVVPSPQIIPAVPPPSSTGRAKSTVKQDISHRSRKAGHPYHRAHAREYADASMSAAPLPEEGRRQASGNAQQASGKRIAGEMPHHTQEPSAVIVDHLHRDRFCTAGGEGRLSGCTGCSARSAAGTSTHLVLSQADLSVPAVSPLLLTETARMEQKIGPGSEQFDGPNVSDPVQLRYPNPTASPGRPHTSPASAVHPPSHADIGTPQLTPSVPYGGSVNSGQHLPENVVSAAEPSSSWDWQNPSYGFTHVEGVAYGWCLAEELTPSPQGPSRLAQTTGLSGAVDENLVNESVRPLNKQISTYSSLQGAVSVPDCISSNPYSL